MLNFQRNIVWAAMIFLLSSLFVACSTKKNTSLSRGYQGFITKYNVQFNAKTQYKDGIAALRAANKDDYSAILSMFPVVDKETGGAISAQMTTTVEKCRKAIKLHSIRKKPTKKPLGMKDAEYQEFKIREEFNPQIKLAWLLLGKAEFYKADFMGAIGDFNYLSRHYSFATATVCEAKLWVARAYAEMGWLYEAESALQNINENSIPTSLNGTFAAFKANILLKQKRYKEAIPFLIVAIDKEKDKYLLARFEFILGQLYELSGQNSLATEHFLKAKSKAQNYEMLFNAELRAYESEKNSAKAIKSLKKMAKSSNNKNYLDQIYFAVGNQYLRNDNEPKAIEYYRLAMEKSTRNGLEKALVALKLGDLYYAKQEYILSAPLYDSVVKMMPNTHIEYARAEKSAEILGELVQNYNVVLLQDSLLALSEMTEEEQLKIINKIIENLIAEEKQAAKDSADRAALAVARSFDREDGFDTPLPGTMSSADWYFYNSSLISHGKREFENKWGRRILEDNWRRTNKVSVSANNFETDTLENADELSQLLDTVATDKHEPAFYLAQIPKTEAQKNSALLQIADALYNMGGIFLTKLQDDKKADETYRIFQNRFPADDRKCETYYYVYQILGRIKDGEQANFRDKIIDECPESKFAIMLKNPDYAEKMSKLIQIQDSLYAETYKAYTTAKFGVVEQNYQMMSQDFPLSDLMPKFTFLYSLVVGKTGSREQFEAELNALVAKYPDSDVTPMSRDILALMLQGREKSETVSATTLNDLRNKETTEEIETIKASAGNFTANISEPQNLIFIPKIANKTLINNLLYDVAAYSFNKFLIKDFDFEIKKIDKKDALVISGIESEEEAKWYKNLLFTDTAFAGLDYLSDFTILTISDSNLQILGQGKSLEEYLKFSGK
ncbi:MAG: hypothetical protein LBS50_07460 [Prevotellaceae bacterium]|jgi:tetratricopeptide (TPR) repeat protein|nr:hypothetical protein [Prevotellaceae bacterium]